MPTINERYRELHPTSLKLYEKAEGLFPDGVTHDTRWVTLFPIYVTHGMGPRKWDVDGIEYVDYVMGHGALLLGHSHPAVVAAVANQVAKGTHLGASHEIEIRWAEAVTRLIPSAEKVRFTSSGTEATLMALRLARADATAQRLKRSLLNAGVDPMGGRTYIVSATHREQDIDSTIGAFEEALTAMRNEGLV